MTYPALTQTQCSIEKLAELPVTMDGLSPTTEAKLNGISTHFIVDSGAFSSIITPGNALILGLKPKPVRDMYMVGVNGRTNMDLVKVASFSVGGTDLGRAQLIVGGSEVGEAGVLGQDLLGYGDIEYDLPHGAVRLFKSQGCDHLSMAYWAAGRAMETIPIEPHSRERPETVGKVVINGKSLDAIFDTGATTSIITLKAAERVGIRPSSEGVKPTNDISGFGRQYVRAWIAPFASFKIGEEEIKNTKILIGAVTIDADMLVGADFFIAHRIYVSNAQRKMFLTYEGGPVFNLKARRQDAHGQDVKGTESPPDEPSDAAGLVRSGAVAFAREDYDKAIADLSKAIALAPNEPHHLILRAAAYVAKDQNDKAIADLDEALTLEPNNLEALMKRASLRIDKKDEAGAIADLYTADQVTAPAADEKYRIAELYVDAAAPARAIAPMSLWITAHPIDSRYISAMNFRCWTRGLANQELAAGLGDCNDVLRLSPGLLAARDSRGLIELRMGQWSKAISDYNAVIAKQPNASWSLYGRGVAKQRLGDQGGSKADIDAARAAWPQIIERVKRFGIGP